MADTINNKFDVPYALRLKSNGYSNRDGYDVLQHVWEDAKKMYLPIPGMRAIANPNEWFAEGFREYMSGYNKRKNLEKQCPKTYRLIDTFVKGGFFKKLSPDNISVDVTAPARLGD